MSGTVQDYSCVILSKKAVTEKGENYQRDPVGTGVYQFVSLDPDPSKGIMMTANPNYFNGPPQIKNLQVQYILDTTARTLALLNGDVHMIEGVRAPGWVPSMQKKSPNLKFDVAAPGSLFTLTFNLKRKPLDDLRVRQAFAYAIDRDVIAKAMAPISRRTYGLNQASAWRRLFVCGALLFAMWPDECAGCICYGFGWRFTEAGAANAAPEDYCFGLHQP